MKILRFTLLAFDGMEALDFAGPYEVFTTASRVYQKMHPHSDAWCSVHTVAASPGPVATRAGLKILPDASMDTTSHAADEVLLIPGGIIDGPLHAPKSLLWIRIRARTAGVTASVCTGAFLLAASGVIRTERVTTHWEDADDLQRQFPELKVETNVRWIDEGRVVTSAGISAGIDMCLHLVSRLGGALLAERTAHQMDFKWTHS